MPHRRIVEHIGAVAEHRDHKLFRRRELGAERRAEAPAEPAGGRQAVEGAGLLTRAMVLHQRVFIEDDGVAADDLADDAAEIGGCDLGALGRGRNLGKLLGPLALVLGGTDATGADARLG